MKRIFLFLFLFTFFYCYPQIRTDCPFVGYDELYFTGNSCDNDVVIHFTFTFLSSGAYTVQLALPDSSTLTLDSFVWNFNDSFSYKTIAYHVTGSGNYFMQVIYIYSGDMTCGYSKNIDIPACATDIKNMPDTDMPEKINYYNYLGQFQDKIEGIPLIEERIYRTGYKTYKRVQFTN